MKKTIFISDLSINELIDMQNEVIADTSDRWQNKDLIIDWIQSIIEKKINPKL